MGEKDAKVKKIIAEKLGVSEDRVTPRASSADDLGAESLDLVELMMAFEDAFGFEISDEDADKLRTVRDALAYIDSRL